MHCRFSHPDMRAHVVDCVWYFNVCFLQEKDETNFYILVVFVICMFAYFIADAFLALYKMAIDTIFLCFAEDTKHNNGKDKPYYMSDAFMKFMNKASIDMAKDQSTSY